MQKTNPLRGKIAAVCVEIPLADFLAHVSTAILGADKIKTR